jgi:hypothetical protein
MQCGKPKKNIYIYADKNVDIIFNELKTGLNQPARVIDNYSNVINW